MDKKIAIIGSEGQLANDLISVLRTDYELDLIPHSTLSIEKSDDVKNYFEKNPADFIINTSAFHNTTDCERFPQKAFEINSNALISLVKVANEIDSTLIHCSTNYVFGGDETHLIPYKEDDYPFPVNIYGLSKLAGEYIIRNHCNNWYIFRLSGLYGTKGTRGKKYKNFIEMMIQLSEGKKELPSNNEERLTFTNTKTIASVIHEMLPKKKYGLYHLTDKGDSTRYEFTEYLYHLMDINCKLKPVGISYFNTPFKQPKYSVLDLSKILKLGIKVPNWKESLEKYVQERINNKDNF